MGMSASQARYLALTSRMNDIEFQGQQINQQRTTLASQINALYNTMLEMSVPTPPSKQDYTKIVYKGVDGASSFTIDNVVPHGTEYSIDFNYKKTGHAITSAGTSTATYTPAKLNLSPIDADKVFKKGTEEVNAAYSCTQVGNQELQDGQNVLKKFTGDRSQLAGTSVYVLNGSGEMELVPYNDSLGDIYSPESAFKTNAEGEKIKNYDENDYILGKQIKGHVAATEDSIGMATNWNEVYLKTSNDSVRKATEADFDWKNGVAYYKPELSGSYLVSNPSGTSYDNPDYDGSHKYNVAGQTCYTLEEAYQTNRFSDLDEYKSMQEAITNAFPGKKPEDFQVYFTTSNSGKLEPHFVAIDSFSVLNTNTNGTKQVTTYDYVANGQYTSAENKDRCKLEFDNNGRITKVQIPRYDANSNLTGYTTIPLEAAEEVDTAAYDDAFNNYEYEKNQYDKEQQEINAQTSIIQAQDKSLELKLTRLDHERTAVNTELEAVKKVITDNIDKSYKTFSG